MSDKKSPLPASVLWQPTPEEQKEWQSDLKLLRNLLQKSPSWNPKIELQPYVVNKELLTRFWIRKLLKLLTVYNEDLVAETKALFNKKDLHVKEVIELLNRKTTIREIKSRRLRKVKNKKLEKEIKESNKLYTFKLEKDQNNLTAYHLFDGKKKFKFIGAKNFLDFLLKEVKENGEEKTIVLFGWNSLSLDNLHFLLQESLLRGFFPSVKGGKTIGSCFLKGDSMIIKDPAKFYLEQDKKTEKLDKLHTLIEKTNKKIKNKYQVDILDKEISTLSKVAWSDFWKTFKKDQEVNDWENIWDFSKKEDEFIRKGFRGGYVDLFNEQNYKGVVSDWDFKNYYPSLMASHSYPISRPEWINHPQDFYGKSWKKDFYGFYECEIECLKENPYPFFTFEDEKSYIYRPGKYQAVLFSEEIKFFWEYTPLIKIEVGKGCAFKNRQYIFSSWIRKLYASQEKGDKLAKIKMNSVYGMFGREKSQTPLIWSIKKTDNTKDEFRRKDGGKVYLNLSEEPKQSKKFTNVGISATIAAYGRIGLFKALLANWENVLYCANDGFVIKGTENKYKPKPIFYKCGELVKKGEYQGFTSLAPNVYAFKDESGKLIGKGLLKKLENYKFDFLFEKQITKENIEEVFKKIPKRQEGGRALINAMNEVDNQKKKKLVNGKWCNY